MKKVLIICLCGVLIAGGLYFFRRPDTAENTPVAFPTETEITYKKKEVVFKNTQYVLDVADSATLRENGLSYRTSLAPGTGMLFVFDAPGILGFWMKDMNFPIDIIWLDQNKKIVHIEHSVATSTYPKSFGPETLAQYVIEIPAGEVKKVGLVLGDTVIF